VLLRGRKRRVAIGADPAEGESKLVEMLIGEVRMCVVRNQLPERFENPYSYWGTVHEPGRRFWPIELQ
jgi:hypothetical protein